MPETSGACHLDIIAAYSIRGAWCTPSLEKRICILTISERATKVLVSKNDVRPQPPLLLFFPTPPGWTPVCPNYFFDQLDYIIYPIAIAGRLLRFRGLGRVANFLGQRKYMLLNTSRPKSSVLWVSGSAPIPLGARDWSRSVTARGDPWWSAANSNVTRPTRTVLTLAIRHQRPCNVQL